MAGRLLFRYFYGLSQEKREWVNLAEVRAGQLPAPGAVDFQAVPLCLQKNAKGGENGTQLASLRQAPHFLQRIFLRAKRKPAPGIRHIHSNSHWPAGGLEGVKRLFYCQVKALFLSEGRRKSPGAGDSVWGLTGALAGGGMMREG